MPEFVTLTPTWAGLMPALVAVLRDGTPEGQAAAEAELFRLARSLDARIVEDRALADAADRERPRFEAVLWTHDLVEAMPLTIAVIQEDAGTVTAYAAGGHHPAETNLPAFGTRLTERQARNYGCGWPGHLRYRA